MVVPGSAWADSTRVHSTKLNEHKGHSSGARAKARQCHRPVGVSIDGQSNATGWPSGTRVARSLSQWPESGDGNTYDGTRVYRV